MSTLVEELTTASGQCIQVRRGDLTDESTEAIMNAANAHLAHGGGVAGAIVRKGGLAIQEESDRWVLEHGPVPVGRVAVTGAGRLPFRRIIHAVGPIWKDGTHGEAGLLSAAVLEGLCVADRLGLASIALPAISSGIFGFPKPLCAAILIRTAVDFCLTHPKSKLREIRLTNIDAATTDLLATELRRRKTA